MTEGPVEQPASQDPRADRVAKAVATWTRHLVDLGGRNTLLWYRDLPTGTLDLTTAHPSGLARLLAGGPCKLSDLVREPAALGEARRRARAIAGKTRELKQERGIGTGFLAIGMATWTERKSSRPPSAPVLLRTCVLRPTGAAHEDFILDLGEEVELNPVLRHYLASEQGIDVDPDALEDMALARGRFDPEPAFAALTDLCASVPRFTIAPRFVVGNFSYAKLPMVADLAAQGADLANHDVIAALAGDPTALASVRSHILEPMASDPDPEREYLVLDADSTQEAVIEAVRSGANLVVKGPPGTGKSQTIVNLVATLVADGKRVLFVAEKRAAIDAVVDRLEGVGLGDLVLDLHGGTTSRRRVAAELGRALESGLASAGPTGQPVRTELIARRRALTDHVTALHEERSPWGVSAYAAQEEVLTLTSLPEPPHSHVRLHGDRLAAMPRSRVDELGRELVDAGARGAWSSDHDGDPWHGARISTPEEALAARERTTRLAEGGLDAMQARMQEVFAGLHLPAVERVADWGTILTNIASVRDTLEVFRPDVFDIPLEQLVAATGSSAQRRDAGVDLGWLERRRLRRQAKSLLRPGRPPADLHGALVDAAAQRGTWRAMAGGGGRPELPPDLDVAEAAYRSLTADLEWLGERLAETRDGGDLLDMPLPALRTRVAALDAHPDRLAVIPTVLPTLDALREAGLQPLVDDLGARAVPPDRARAELDFVWWTSVIEDLALRDPRYGGHHGDALRATEAAFAAADREHVSSTAARVRAAAAAELRRVLADHPQGEALVRAEAAKSRRHRTLTDLMTVAGPVVTAIKPCIAMSPLVVASALPAGQLFDVVIFDEASQIPPAQAVSSISRARQVVVVGDEHQLPPTTFFMTSAADDDEAAPEDDGLTEGFESVLDVLTAALPARTLRWHYRSRDERLIAFANREVYGGALVTFPGTGTEPVLTLEHVDGTGVTVEADRGVETTTAEVDRVVELVLEHARARPEESLGVIALGISHANRIEEALRARFVKVTHDEPDLAAFFDESRPQPFFVKNLERVQGDERDAVILSVGYGKTPHGRVLHRFGPLNTEGGERRLNVAVTRARVRMTVVSSLTAEDLDPSRLKARGAVMLRDFLAYAAAGGPSAGSASAGRGQSRVVADFAARLRRSGLTVEESYGASEHPIDLTVRGPGPGPVLAVEADGPAYAALRTTRDRDRLRAEHLARLGWTPVRVWTTDLFRDPARDVSRVTALAMAHDAPTDPAADTARSTEPRAVGPELDQTRDDPDAGWGEREDRRARDRWLQEQRPPHWE